jgi:hypothetical protein
MVDEFADIKERLERVTGAMTRNYLTTYTICN